MTETHPILSDSELLRYSRHILLPEVDIVGQEKLAQARVLIIGLGGLGSPVALYLAAAGVGRLLLADHDEVDLSNLQRQVIHQTASLGLNKALSAQQQIAQLNPNCHTDVLPAYLYDAQLNAVLPEVDVVVDCSDNFATRQSINRACVAAGKPLVSGAAIGFSGQIAVFNLGESSPCYSCLYPELPEAQLSCSQSGVIAPLVGVIGSYQALEAVKILIGCGESLAGRLQLFDGLSGQWQTIKLAKDPACPVCGTKPTTPPNGE
ncbi:MAG TPA: molybdopterin-synthase adenylyltransferase MoeB [Cellvibrionaceae bacterium]|nr:molybdopterin-synthase adenylyltransferase MoeB [Cellvibrionaceae bacterium]